MPYCPVQNKRVPVQQKWSLSVLFPSTPRAIQHAAWGNINKYSQWEGARWGKEMEPAAFWTVFNERSFIMPTQNCSLIFVSIRSQVTLLPSLLGSPWKTCIEGHKRVPFLIILAKTNQGLQSERQGARRRTGSSRAGSLGQTHRPMCHRARLQLRGPMHIHTQKFLSGYKLTKQEQFSVLHGFLRRTCSNLKLCPLCHSPAFSYLYSSICKATTTTVALGHQERVNNNSVLFAF